MASDTPGFRGRELATGARYTLHGHEMSRSGNACTGLMENALRRILRLRASEHVQLRMH